MYCIHRRCDPRACWWLRTVEPILGGCVRRSLLLHALYSFIIKEQLSDLYITPSDRSTDRSRDKVFFTTGAPRMMKENHDQIFSYALTAVSTGPIQCATRRVILCRNPVDCNHVSCRRLLRPY